VFKDAVPWILVTLIDIGVAGMKICV